MSLHMFHIFVGTMIAHELVANAQALCGVLEFHRFDFAEDAKLPQMSYTSF